MKNKNMAKLVVLKVICCGLLIFFLLGGLSLLTGLSTGNAILSVLGISVLLWATYKLSVATLNKYNKKDV